MVLVDGGLEKFLYNWLTEMIDSGLPTIFIIPLESAGRIWKNILLQTKLHRPRLPKDVLQRSACSWKLLITIFTTASSSLSAHQLVLGETTLAGTWLECMAEDQGKKAAAIPADGLSPNKRAHPTSS